MTDLETRLHLNHVLVEHTGQVFSLYPLLPKTAQYKGRLNIKIEYISTQNIKTRFKCVFDVG